ncbi:MAG: VOC family protein [Rhodospirillaceae bacterium]|nr:VOC family protein [Rhodospirillaceae bacterium]
MNHFGFTKLVVADLEKSAAFYKATAGFTEQARVDDAIEGRRIQEIMFNPTTPGASTFVLLSYPDAPKPVQGELITGFITDDIAGFVQRAERAGGRITEAPHAKPEHGVKVGFVRDPEGHLIEVVEMLAK